MIYNKFSGIEVALTRDARLIKLFIVTITSELGLCKGLARKTLSSI